MDEVHETMDTALMDQAVADAPHLARQRRRVLFIDELAARLGCSRKTIERRLQTGTFPIKPLPSIDNRKRWAEDEVEAWERGRVTR